LIDGCLIQCGIAVYEWLLLLIAADLTLAFAPGIGGLVAGVVLWGLHMGFSR
jgi:hypothetical protein